MKREDLDTYSRQIRRAAKDVSKLRQSGKGPDGSQVLFPHLPYLLKEEVLIFPGKKERRFFDFERKPKTMMQSFPSVSAVPIWEIRCFLISSAVPTGTSLLKKSERISPDLFFRSECRSGKFDGPGFLHQKGSRANCESPDEGTTPCDFQVWHYH